MSKHKCSTPSWDKQEIKSLWETDKSNTSNNNFLTLRSKQDQPCVEEIFRFLHSYILLTIVRILILYPSKDGQIYENTRVPPWPNHMFHLELGSLLLILPLSSVLVIAPLLTRLLNCFRPVVTTYLLNLSPWKLC